MNETRELTTDAWLVATIKGTVSAMVRPENMVDDDETSNAERVPVK